MLNFGAMFLIGADFMIYVHFCTHGHSSERGEIIASQRRFSNFYRKQASKTHTHIQGKLFDIKRHHTIWPHSAVPVCCVQGLPSGGAQNEGEFLESMFAVLRAATDAGVLTGDLTPPPATGAGSSISGETSFTQPRCSMDSTRFWL